MSEINFINNMNPFIRWIILIPASIILWIISYPIIYWLNYYTISTYLMLEPNDFFLKVYLNLFSSYVSTLALLWSALEISPKYKMNILRIYSSILVIIMISLVYVKLELSNISKISMLDLTINFIGTILAVIQMFSQYKEYKNEIFVKGQLNE